MSKKFRINKTLNIGSPDAETDELLFEAYVESDILSEVLDTKSQKCILLGRTGSGKSAIIQYLEKSCENIKRIEPEAMSLQFLSNSTILKYFRELDINLNLFFKVLWKHVFVVELIKLYFPDDFKKEKQGIWISQMKEKILKRMGKMDPSKEKALNYLDKWTDKFWLDTEYQIRELEKTISDNFKVSAGFDISEISSQLSYEKGINSKYQSDVKHKAESVIHEVQSKELIEIVRFLKNDLFVEHQKKFYIVIDDLDKEWIEAGFRYDLIGAMVEVIKELRSFKGVKIVISLRENLSELLKLGSKHEGGQREKFKPLYAHMQWEKPELIQFLDRRLKVVSGNNLDVRNAFYQVRKTNELGVDYVLKRTYMRPRDVIAFVNHAIGKANSKTQFTRDIIHKAEVPYSIERFQALEDEWRENYGDIQSICRFLNGIMDGFRLKSINEVSFTDVYCDDDYQKQYRGVLCEAVKSWRESKINFNGFFKKIVFLLYHIGILGIKKGPTFPVVFFYDEISIQREDISNNNKYYVHPSLYSYFKVNTMEQLPLDQ